MLQIKFDAELKIRDSFEQVLQNFLFQLLLLLLFTQKLLIYWSWVFSPSKRHQVTLHFFSLS